MPVAGERWPVYGTSTLETSAGLEFFCFKGYQAGLGAVDPIFAGLERREHRKIQLGHGEVTKGLEGKADNDVPCSYRANYVTMNVEISDYFYSRKKKKVFRSHHREKERERK